MKLDQLIKDAYTQTWSIDWMGETFTFQKEYQADILFQAQQKPKADQNAFLISVLAVNPKINFPQAKRLPMSFNVKFGVKFKELNEAMGEDLGISVPKNPSSI